MSNEQIVQVDVDELAKEKLQEIESLLEDSTRNHKLGEIESWLSILKQIITAAGLHRTKDNDEQVKDKPEENIYADFSDDNEQFNQVDLTEQFASNSVKWTIRVRAFKLVHRLVRMFSDAKRSDGFIRSATSPYDDLKLQGFEMFKFVINRFALVEEVEFPGQSILNQYRTQVISALKPAFDVDAPPYITAIASQVCCIWICKGLEKSRSDLKRTYQLMSATIDKLENQSRNQNSKLYTESELEQERLDILGSWAQLYIVAKETNYTPTLCKFDTVYLHELVVPHMNLLVDKWWEALREYALLIMPAPKMIAISHDNEHVYTREVALRLFKPVWPRLILASTLCSCSNNNLSKEHNKYFKFICGIILKEFCKCSSLEGNESNLELRESNEDSEATLFSLKSLECLLGTDEFKLVMVEEWSVIQEFYSVLYSILINQVKFRSSSYVILKEVLDNLLKLVVKKVAQCELEDLYRIPMSLVTMIRKDLEAIKSTSASEISRTNLSIRIEALISLIAQEPRLLAEQSDVRCGITSSFKEILLFKDHSIYAHFLKQLSDLESILPQDSLSVLTSELADAKNDALSRFTSTTKTSVNKSSTTTNSGAHGKISEEVKTKDVVEKSNSRKKPVPKIVLKADFSNFYSNHKTISK